METGKVKWFNESKGYGFITDDAGVDVFFHYSALQLPGFKTLKEGQTVRFERVQGPKGVQARSVEILDEGLQIIGESKAFPQSLSPHGPSGVSDPDMESEEIEELDTHKVDQVLLREISNWKREAKAEDNDRYFWHVSEVDQITRGGKYFVIGRKGSGKTAICEYFNRKHDHDIFAEKLSFKNFPFNVLYSQKNTKYTPPNQFISIWKYVIYSTICRLMLKNQGIGVTIRDQLGMLYGDSTPFARRVGQWVGKEFGISLFGLSIKVSRQPSAPPESWIGYLDFLEDFVIENAGSATYYVLFDELDEDYRKIVEEEQYEQYTALITSLFKAVQDIRTTTGQNGNLRIYPVIFLRDDIYELVQDSDKNKWGDFKVDLNWDTEKIKKVMAFRISRSIDPVCSEILSLGDAWKKVFGSRPMAMGHRARKRLSAFDFIARSTLLRPRDFVEYLKNCAQQATDEKCKIGREVVIRVDKAFSNYLRDELTDELFAVLPDISSIFDAISQLRKWNFSISELEHAIGDKISRGFIKEKNVSFILQILYLFSVIGNQIRPGRNVFRYQNREARLNFNERVVVHRGLFKALQIL